MPKILALKDGNIGYTCLEEDHNIWKKKITRQSLSKRKGFQTNESKYAMASRDFWLDYKSQSSCQDYSNSHATTFESLGIHNDKGPPKPSNKPKHKYSCSSVNNILMLEICKSRKAMTQTVTSVIRDRGQFTKDLACPIAISL